MFMNLPYQPEPKPKLSKNAGLWWCVGNGKVGVGKTWQEAWDNAIDLIPKPITVPDNPFEKLRRQMNPSY